MDPSAGKTKPGHEPSPRRPARGSLREIYESLPLGDQFRLSTLAAVLATVLVVQLLGALWDTRIARGAAIDLAERRAASMAERLHAAGGGALDDLAVHPELLAAAFSLEGGEVLQRYVRGASTTGAAAAPSGAAGWTVRPAGWMNTVRAYLALGPIYVEHRVELSGGLGGRVSIVVDHLWIWKQALYRLALIPVVLLLGGLGAWVAANTLRRKVVEPLAQLVEATRPKAGAGAASTAAGRGGNELRDLAHNFEALATQLADAESAMSTVRHAANQQVIERTQELETRLRRAEAVARSKEDFMASMSHEIRTPMNGVLGMAELLAGTELDKRQRRFVDSMRAAAETMMGIINDILDESKIAAGKMDLVQEPFDVRELAEQAGQLYAGQAESKKLEMICRIEPTVPLTVVGDALRLRQVLGNLLSNAVKYTDHGEVEIRVGLDDLRDGQCRLHFSVRDTGPGIADTDRSGVFEAFTQLDNGSRTGGTGLGLSIATRLVRLMGGEKIDLTSEVGRGSTFSFVLPFEIREAAQAAERKDSEFAGLRVLVVDDNSTSYMLLEEMLSNWSAEVTVLNRARLVGDRMHDVATRGRAFDLVLLDHSLPDATTEELLRTIRLDPAIAGTYVVLLSALDFNASYEGTRAIAPDVCIAKPVRQQLLRSALEASRLPRKAHAAPAAPATAPGGPVDTAERQSTTERPDLPELGLTVLVADDNAINREVAVAMLEELGCRSVLAEDGATAVAAAEQQRFGAILMDCQMPGMDGYAATEAIRRSEAARGVAPVTIVALTANVLARDRERCIAAGMNGFLAKPFRATQLAEILQPVATKRPVPAEADLLPPQVAARPAAPEATASEAAAPEVVDLLSDADVDVLLEAPVATAAPASRLPVLDPEQVQAIRGLGKPQVFERLCEMLFTSAREAFARLDAALADGRLEEVAAAAHAFKSPVANLGGRRLADLLERCETAAREGADLAVVRRAATGLKPHYAALVAALEAETRRATGTG